MKQFLQSIAVITTAALAFSCHKSNVDQKDLRDFKQVNLVANTAEYHPVTIDPTLINGFGIAWSPNGIAWVNSVGGHVSELYTAEGAIARKPVNIPQPNDTIGGFPCGIVFNPTKGFNIPTGPSLFLFTSFDGVLSGWNGAAGNNAQRIKAPSKASYTGLAIAASGGHTFIYGANFGLKKIDTWDSNFNLIKMPFVDPTLPKDYSPYNIQAVGDWLFVIYAKLGDDGHGVAGAGNGYVSIFNTNGTFVRRFASRGTLNIPWGVTMAPGSFLEDKDMDDEDNNGGVYSIASNHGSTITAGTPNSSSSSGNNGGNSYKHDPKDPVILVGNFGNGRINVFSQQGNYLGQLQSHKHTIEIDGLWALSFAPATATTVDPARLYFSAGPDQEKDGLFGYLIKQ